jgi:hypothetical protein
VRRLASAIAVALLLLLAGCASVVPTAVEERPPAPVEPEFVPAPPAPLVESPPLEPVPAPAPSETPAPVPTPSPTPPAPPPSTGRPAPGEAPPPAPAQPVPPGARPVPPPGQPPAATSPPVESPEDAQLNALLADLARFTALGADELRRELPNATQALNRQRNDANRVRLAVLYTLSRNGTQDDLRALQLFDNVAHSGGPASGVKALATVLHAQVAERVREVREEQQKGEQAVRKLDQLLEMERTLLRDRVRSGGGGGAGGAGGSSR